jgi:nucleotide-binding universal stress UspA family protein
MSVRILVAYDGSAAAEAAITTAGRLFGGTTGRLLTVVDLLPSLADAPTLGLGLDAPGVQRGIEALWAELMQAGAELAARGAATAESAGLMLDPAPVRRAGTTWQTILAGAEAIDADVIVCGSRGRGGVARSLLGSTSASVLHHATRPVLVVPSEPAAPDGPAVIAFDGSAGARAAVAVAARLLRGRPAVIVHVWFSSIRHTLTGRALAHGPIHDLRDFAADYEQGFADAAAAVVDDGVALARQAGLDASGRLVESDAGAWRALAEAAVDERAAVIVSGSRGHGGVASTVLGSVSSGLVHNAQISALVVRPES